MTYSMLLFWISGVVCGMAEKGLSIWETLSAFLLGQIIGACIRDWKF